MAFIVQIGKTCIPFWIIRDGSCGMSIWMFEYFCANWKWRTVLSSCHHWSIILVFSDWGYNIGTGFVKKYKWPTSEILRYTYRGKQHALIQRHQFFWMSWKITRHWRKMGFMFSSLTVKMSKNKLPDLAKRASVEKAVKS